MSNRLRAYGMLVHDALNEIHECCPRCCASCGAIQILDNEGILDEVVQLWDTYDDGTPVLRDGDPLWWEHGRVNRQWLYANWQNTDCHRTE